MYFFPMTPFPKHGRLAQQCKKKKKQHIDIYIFEVKNMEKNFSCTQRLTKPVFNNIDFTVILSHKLSTRLLGKKISCPTLMLLNAILQFL